MIRLRSSDRLLLEAEQSIALLERCRPINRISELDRIGDAWERGHEAEPSFEYARSPSLGGLRRALSTIVEHARALGPLGPLYAARAEELHYEASLVEQVGTATFRRTAERRFFPSGEIWARRADALCDRWLGLEATPPEGPWIESDSDDPRSLVSALGRAIGARRLPVRIVVRDGLSTVAAVGRDVVYVRAGVPLTSSDVLRLVVHELDGHAAPRVASHRQGLGLLQAGTAGSNADEEGRALLLEKRADLLTTARSRELAERHLAARVLRAGASWVETARALIREGASRRRAAEVTARVFRGGGLAREIIYLPGLCRVEEAFAERPALERWFERGRVSVDAALALERCGHVADEPGFGRDFGTSGQPDPFALHPTGGRAERRLAHS